MNDAITALAHYRAVRGHSEATARYDRVILGMLGKHPAEATPADLEAILLRSKSPATRSTYSGRIRSVFFALRECGIIPPDHCPDDALPRLKRPRHQPRPLADEDVRRLLAGAREPFNTMFRIALLTGARAMELWAMEGADLTSGLHGPELLLHGKGGKEEAIPAHPTVVDLIEGFGTLGRLWPQWGSPGVLSQRACDELARVLGPGHRLHQLRHTFATRLLRATSDVVTVSKLMRHSNIQTTLNYTLIADESKVDAILALSA